MSSWKEIEDLKVFPDVLIDVINSYYSCLADTFRPEFMKSKLVRAFYQDHDILLQDQLSILAPSIVNKWVSSSPCVQVLCISSREGQRFIRLKFLTELKNHRLGPSAQWDRTFSTTERLNPKTQVLFGTPFQIMALIAYRKLHLSTIRCLLLDELEILPHPSILPILKALDPSTQILGATHSNLFQSQYEDLFQVHLSHYFTRISIGDEGNPLWNMFSVK